MESSLSGVRVLTTRPAHQSRDWCELLAAEGATVDTIPLLAIEPIESGPEYQRTKNQVMDFDQVDHAIFVSRNAVRLAFDWLDAYWPQLPVGPRYYAIGAGTARDLESHGPECTSAGGAMDSEALLALPSLQQVDGERVLIFRGAGGRTLIGDTLRERNARVEYCELYRRTLPADATRRLREYRATPDIITVHSGETLDNLASCLQKSGRGDLFRALLVCPSARVGERARDLGFSRIAVARNAGDAAMLAAVENASPD
ncbi:uroporphyrinogen-III synthase [Microbulbifer yueqingensis]|uniref:Uroporphyrinogen-III synthase n=1 Tax=Microbulbifer yueqingensis TaxID=658219 RepID=A0A1G9D1K7_9GAMM|nr:uroporphyrinogen-III synthase [Microbulbifer yueqingensis]SDK57826.1 uroporphyrinogen-III synthase [Microbulbifer yueqingensis]